MGINCTIRLPDNVRADDVATVIGVAVGCKATYEKFSTGGSDGGSTNVPGVKVTTTSVPSMAYIIFDRRHCNYFFENESGGRLVHCGDAPLWQAVGRRLVDFFGGQVDYNDCDDTDVDYKKRPKSRAVNAPTDGEDWENFQQRLLVVPRIHRDEVGDGDGIETFTFDEQGLMVR